MCGHTYMRNVDTCFWLYLREMWILWWLLWLFPLFSQHVLGWIFRVILVHVEKHYLTRWWTQLFLLIISGCRKPSRLWAGWWCLLRRGLYGSFRYHPSSWWSWSDDNRHAFIQYTWICQKDTQFQVTQLHALWSTSANDTSHGGFP